MNTQSQKIFESGSALPKEREAVRLLLDKNNVRYYETPDSVKTRGAFWVKGEEEYRKARQLIEAFQADLEKKAKENYRRTLNKRWGGSHTQWLAANIKNRKTGFVLGSVLAAFVLWYAFN